jgi:hypothetical protein
VDARTRRPFIERLVEVVKLFIGMALITPQLLLGKKRIKRSGLRSVKRTSRNLLTCHQTLIRTTPMGTNWVDVRVIYNDGPEFAFELNAEEREEFAEMIKET